MDRIDDQRKNRGPKDDDDARRHADAGPHNYYGKEGDIGNTVDSGDDRLKGRVQPRKPADGQSDENADDERDRKPEKKTLRRDEQMAEKFRRRKESQRGP